jgi:hypothetical protein
VAIGDRGFRDATEFLKKMHGLQVEMPSYLKKGTSQHPTDESNMSRLVSKVRWVVVGSPPNKISPFNQTFYMVFHACSHKHLLCQSLTFCIEA